MHSPVADDQAALHGLEENFWSLWSRFGRGPGYRRAILHSTRMAHHIYESIGFRDRLPFVILAPPGALHL